ncbi:MAG: hypothetical protein ABIP48_24335 [Planctomycetota bacterium]
MAFTFKPGKQAWYINDVVRFLLIETSTVIDAPRQYSFGLQALPVRPRSSLYRRFKSDDCTWTSDATKELFSIRPLYTEGWSGHWYDLGGGRPRQRQASR